GPILLFSSLGRFGTSLPATAEPSAAQAEGCSAAPAGTGKVMDDTHQPSEALRLAPYRAEDADCPEPPPPEGFLPLRLLLQPGGSRPGPAACPWRGPAQPGPRPATPPRTFASACPT